MDDDCMMLEVFQSLLQHYFPEQTVVVCGDALSALSRFSRENSRW